MGTNSTQAWAIVLFIAAFTCLAGALALGGNLLLLALFLAGFGLSAALFLRAKPWEHGHEGGAGAGVEKSKMIAK